MSALAFVMTRLDDRPDAPLSSVVGESARVHLPIPPGAMGEVRVLFGGRIQYLRAVATDEAADFRIGDDVVVMGARPDGILRVAAAREVFGDLPGPRRLADNQEPTT